MGVGWSGVTVATRGGEDGEDRGDRGELVRPGIAADLLPRNTGRDLRSGALRAPGSVVSHRGSSDQSGMFPCFLGGRVWRLLRSARRALMTEERVWDGGITEST